MNSFDKYIQKERNKKCKQLIRLRKARDLSRNHRKKNISMRYLLQIVEFRSLEHFSINTMSKMIYQDHIGKRPSNPGPRKPVTPKRS